MLFVVFAYFSLQIDKYDQNSLKFQFINLFGATLLLISLFVHFNLGSFIIEVVWIIITLYGIYKIIRKKNKSD